MYQLSMSIGSDYACWFYAVEKKLKSKLASLALMVTRPESNRLYIAFACENNHKKKVSNILFDALMDIYAFEAKRHFYKENLIMPLLPPEKYNILLAALIEFDTQSDRELIKETIVLENGLNIDGIYNFKFGEIKARWKDIGELTRENSVYLNDNEIFFELIKYLFSAIKPKTETVTLRYDGNNKYTLIDLSRNEIIKEVFSEEELLCTLISVAPLGLELSGAHIDKSVCAKLNTIFGLGKKLSKSENN